MYAHNTHQNPGVYTIRGDMCYDNKLMANTALPGRPPPESIRIVAEVGDGSSTASKERRRRRFLRVPYVANGIVISIVIISLLLFEYGLVPSTKLGFYCKDPINSFPFQGDTINLWTLLLGSLLVPFLLFLAVEWYREQCFNKELKTVVWRWYGQFLVGFNLNLFLVEVMKVVVGEHRPHFFDSCSPDTETTCTPGAWVEEYKCMNTIYSNYQILDASRSFPSGHSSLSIYVSLFCAAFVHLRLPTRKLGPLAKPVLIGLCLPWGLVCSLTRITDHRHHWWDVLAGTVIGFAITYYTVVWYGNKFHFTHKPRPHRPSASTTTLLDVKNKDATSVII